MANRHPTHARPPVGLRINRSRPLGKSALGYWPLNEGGGAYAQDASGNGCIGTMTNFSDMKTAWSPPLGKYRCNFPASTNACDVRNAPGVTKTRGSIAFWFMVTAYDSSRNTFWSWGNSNATTWVWNVRLNSSDDSGAPSAGNARITIRAFDNASVNNDIVGSTNIALNTEYFCVVTGDGSAYKFYINGVPETLTAVGGSNNGIWVGGQAGIAGTYKAVIGDMYFANTFQANMQANSYMRNVGLFDRVISHAEVRRLYTNPNLLFDRPQRRMIAGPSGSFIRGYQTGGNLTGRNVGILTGGAL